MTPLPRFSESDSNGWTPKVVTIDGRNYVSVDDLADLVDAVYERHEYVSETAFDQIEALVERKRTSSEEKP